MTVKELIEELQNMPSDYEVVYEGGWPIEIVEIDDTLKEGSLERW